MNKQRKVLIADDSKFNQELLTELLGGTYEYLYADNGAQVIDLLSNGVEVDIILLDVNMPIMDGFEVLKVMNDRHWLEETPVVVISGEWETEFLRKAYALGATDYISRPFSDIVVQYRVENTLKIYMKQRQLVQLVEEQVYEREELSNTMINIFSHTVEQRNFESGKHSFNISKISDMLLHELITLTDQYKLTEKSIATIASLAALHDIGKISIPRAVLNKPGKLDPEEWELMKTHSEKGEQIIASAEIPQNTFAVKTAREICRWHHERWNGKGYPDGLSGEQIPISAQVVALADVYDALTSDRCYKKAFSHELAIEMICNGECGEFNPLLIRCLRQIEPKLSSALEGHYVDHSQDQKIRILTEEVLNDRELPIDDRSSRLLENEKEKKEFFKKLAGEIQFEYERASQKISYINTYKDGTTRIEYYTEATTADLLLKEDSAAFLEKISQATRENPEFTMQVILQINGLPRWHRLSVKTIWPLRGDGYISIVGQFKDIHEDVTSHGLDALLYQAKIGTLYEYLKKIFAVVRIIDPDTLKVLAVTESGEIVESPMHCYDFWDKNAKCENCEYLNVKDDTSISARLESRNGELYSIISKPGKYNGKTFILQMGFPVKGHSNSSRISQLPERTRLMLLDFYKDSVTGTYSRMYLEDFGSSLEDSDAVAMCDVDGFKQINDIYGHVAGDAALKRIAGIMKKTVSGLGVVIRYGGDEFLIVFRRISEEAFQEKIEEIRKRIIGAKLDEYPDLPLKVSIGGAYGEKNLKDAVSEADKQMYRTKSERK